MQKGIGKIKSLEKFLKLGCKESVGSLAGK